MLYLLLDPSAGRLCLWFLLQLLVGLGPEIFDGLGLELLVGLGPELFDGLGLELLVGLGPELLVGLGLELLVGLGPELLLGLGPEHTREYGGGVSLSSADLARGAGGVLFLTGIIRAGEVGMVSGGVYGGGGSFKLDAIKNKQI